MLAAELLKSSFPHKFHGRSLKQTAHVRPRAGQRRRRKQGKLVHLSTENGTALHPVPRRIRMSTSPLRRSFLLRSLRRTRNCSRRSDYTTTLNVLALSETRRSAVSATFVWIVQ